MRRMTARKGLDWLCLDAAGVDSGWLVSVRDRQGRKEERATELCLSRLDRCNHRFERKLWVKSCYQQLFRGKIQ